MSFEENFDSNDNETFHLVQVFFTLDSRNLIIRKEKLIVSDCLDIKLHVFALWT